MQFTTVLAELKNLAIWQGFDSWIGLTNGVLLTFRGTARSLRFSIKVEKPRDDGVGERRQAVDYSNFRVAVTKGAGSRSSLVWSFHNCLQNDNGKRRSRGPHRARLLVLRVMGWW